MLTQQLGSAWLRSKANLALKLPSAAIPGDLSSIVLANTLHLALSQDRREPDGNPLKASRFCATLAHWFWLLI